MNKREKRRIEIINLLCDMSRDSWRNARPADYLPLETELREIESEMKDRAVLRKVRFALRKR